MMFIKLKICEQKQLFPIVLETKMIRNGLDSEVDGGRERQEERIDIMYTVQLNIEIMYIAQMRPLY